MAFVNQHSFTLAAAGAFLVLALVSLRRGLKGGDLAALGALLIGLAAAYRLLQPGPSSLASAQEVRTQIGAGTPVLLEFQSAYCLGCMAARPVVDRIERESEGRLKVIRLNLQDPQAADLVTEFGFVYTPTFIFIDAQGRQLWRTIGAIDPLDVRRSLEGS